MNISYIHSHLLTPTQTPTHSHTLTLLSKPHTLLLSFFGPPEPREDLQTGREPDGRVGPDGRGNLIGRWDLMGGWDLTGACSGRR